ncbi:MAG: DNA topoisomerase IV subunit A [Erysipelotrichaceae bacterium]|nr:DNA topoisomerase IV subunit A [Erysipelotrichaceae bacterium]
MSKKVQTEQTILHETLEEVMESRFGRYSKYIIQDRALPDVRDGLKPVQRRILYAMHIDGNTADKPTRKSAKTVGLVIGNYHPHGDTSVYDAMVRMSQNWKMRIPLIDMQGNNGSIDNDPAAAMRYTEARLAPMASVLLKDIEKNTVLMAPNFDDTEEEPTVLPAGYPNLLVNGTTGIAAGYATNIAPHNLEEVIDATIVRIQNPHCELETVMDCIKGPDFPTGGIVQGRAGILEAFKTGKGRVVVRAKTEIIQQKLVQQIVITEIPYEVVKSALVQKMTEVQLSKDVDGILEIRDESGKEGLRIVVDVKKDMDAGAVLNYLFKNTDLQCYYNYNMVGIVNKRPQLLGVLDILDAFIEHRKEVIIRRTQFDLKKMEARCHILEGLMKMMSILDDVIALIRNSKDKQDAKKGLMATFGFTEPQAEAIVTLRLYRLTNFDIMELRTEFAQLVNDMETNKEILENPKVLNRTMIQELKEIRKNHPSPRMTAIEEEVQEIVIDPTSMIANERVMITISKDGYIKRVSLRSYNASNDVSTGIKEHDRIVGQLEVDTLDNLLVFTDQGNFATLPIYSIEESKWKEIGSHISKLVKVNNAEHITDACVVKDFNTYAWVIVVTGKGMIKRTPMTEWVMQRKSKTSAAINLAKGDEVVRVLIAYEGDDIAIVSKQGYCVRYDVKEIPATSCKSKGVKAMNLSKDDEIASATILNDKTNGVVIFTTKSQNKRIKEADITRYKRPAKGDLIAKKVKTNPNTMRYIFGVNLSSELLWHDGVRYGLQAKEVTLMTKDATFSSALTKEDDWFIYHGISEVRIVDIPDEVEKLPSNDDFDMIQFEL